MLIGLCLGTAAAALVGAGLVETGGERSEGSSVAAGRAAGDAAPPYTVRSAGGARPDIRVETTQQQGAAATSPAPTAESSPDSFVLAVSAVHAT